MYTCISVIHIIIQSYLHRYINASIHTYILYISQFICLSQITSVCPMRSGKKDILKALLSGNYTWQVQGGGVSVLCCHLIETLETAPFSLLIFLNPLKN